MFNKLSKLALLVFFFIGILLVNINLYREDNLTISFFDVGQGDGIHIRTEDGFDVVIDTGRDSLTFISKLSDSMPLTDRKIELVILTHPDADHAAGMPELFDRFEVKSFMYTGFIHDSDLYFEVMEKVGEENNMQYILAHDKNDFKIGCCALIDILWPLKSSDIQSLESNDTSITLNLIHGDNTIFLSGDLSKEYEDEIISRNDFDIDVFKVGHHGSKTSTSENFLRKTNPEIGIISAGVDNSYGHPHNDVVEVLKKYNVQVISTQEKGDLILKSDGNMIYY